MIRQIISLSLPQKPLISLSKSSGMVLQIWQVSFLYSRPNREKHKKSVEIKDEKKIQKWIIIIIIFLYKTLRRRTGVLKSERLVQRKGDTGA